MTHTCWFDLVGPRMATQIPASGDSDANLLMLFGVVGPRALRLSTTLAGRRAMSRDTVDYPSATLD